MALQRSSGNTTTALWFRTGLRLHDNPSLFDAVRGSTTLFPFFIIDPWFADSARVSANRFAFLLDSLNDLDAGLRRLGSRLFVLRGSPVVIIPSLLTQWNVQRLVVERDTEPYARHRDAVVSASCKTMGIEFRSVEGHTLWSVDALIAEAARAGKRVPASFQSFVALTKSLPSPPRPHPAPLALPPLPLRPSDNAVAAAAAAVAASSSSSASAASAAGAAADEFSVPTLAACGYDAGSATSSLRGSGGETAALERLQRHLARKAWIRGFEKPDTSPSALEPSTTLLSPYMAMGCLGVRQFYWGLLDVYAAGGTYTKPPVSLEGQLLWREFFYAQAFITPNFDRMVGNPGCKQIGWGYNRDWIDAWEHSRTGYPWIDAVMAQLRAEGWIHHLARHAVACFLTRGDLYQSWEHGARIFDKYLLDSDWSLNCGNWQWLSASAFFFQFFRVYSPISFQKKADPQGNYIRKWLPAFKDFPAEYIYEPWRAPKAVQQQHNVIIGVTYPARLVDHDAASRNCIARHSAAYAACKAGPAEAAAVAASVPGQAKGVGATQVGSDPAACAAFLARHRVAAGELPGAAGAAAGAAPAAASSSSSSTASAAAEGDRADVLATSAFASSPDSSASAAGVPMSGAGQTTNQRAKKMRRSSPEE